MKVIATKQGYLGKLRQPGDEFEVPDGTKGSWFEPVKQKAEDKKAKQGEKSADKSANDKPADDLV